MASIGHPLVGDSKYGKNSKNFINRFKWQALYSYKVKFSFDDNENRLGYLNGREFEVKDIWFAENNRININK